MSQHVPLHARSLLTLVTSCALIATAGADDWPQWRGPDRDNVSKEQGWSVFGKRAPAWRADVGWGYSSPAIAGGRLIIAGYFEDPATPHEGTDRVSCRNAETGEELWSRSYPAKAYDNEHGGGALSTATILEDTVFVPTRDGEVRAYAVEDGALRWEVDLVERHGVQPGRYGFASSPYVLGANIVLNASKTVCLDRATGDTVWISEAVDANYSTVADVQLGERACVAVFGGEGVAILDSASGETVHSYTFRNSPRNVEGATPLVFGTRVLVSSGYDQGIALVDFGGVEPVEVWRNRRMRNKMAGCTLWDGHLYGFDESMLKCLDLEGNELWRQRGLGHGAMSVADGRLLVTTSEGELIVATATPEEYREDSRRVVVEDGGVFWTAPVLAGGLIYVRGSHGDLVCLDHRDARTSSIAAIGSGESAGEAPAPEEILKRYLSATGLAQKNITALQMIGEMTSDSLGLRKASAVWEIGSGGMFRANLTLPAPFRGEIGYFFDGEAGWTKNPLSGDELLEGAQLDELRRTGGMHTLLAPLAGGAATTSGHETFRGVACHRVDVKIAEDTVRRVYFDAETGLLAGRTSESETTVVFASWRATEGVTLPFQRTEFHPETGEETRYTFERATFEPIDPAHFELPEKLAKELEEGGER